MGIRTFIAFTAFSLSAAISPHASAQNEPTSRIDLSAEQLELNNQAIRALQQQPPDTERALALTETASALGTPNKLTGLTAARAHHLAGRCHAASQKYDEVSRLPGVAGVSDEVMSARVQKYRDELGTCFGTIVVSCDQPGMTTVEITGIRDARCGGFHEVDPKVITVTSQIGVSPPQRQQVTAEAGAVQIVKIAASAGLANAALDTGQQHVARGLRRAFRAAQDEPPRPPADKTNDIVDRRAVYATEPSPIADCASDPRHPRCDHRASLGVSLGTGLGLVSSGSSATAHPEHELSTGLAPAFAHLRLDGHWLLASQMQLGLAFRYQFAPTQDFDELEGSPTVRGGNLVTTRKPCWGIGFNGECALGLRFRHTTASPLDSLRPFFDAELGVGRVRQFLQLRQHAAPGYPGAEECRGKPTQFTTVERDGVSEQIVFCHLRDTVRNGGAYLGLGGGIALPIGKRVDFLVGTTVMLLFPGSLSINADLNLGVAARL